MSTEENVIGFKRQKTNKVIDTTVTASPTNTLINFELSIKKISIDYKSSLTFKIYWVAKNKQSEIETETERSFRYKAPGRKEMFINESLFIITQQIQSNNSKETILNFFETRILLKIKTGTGYKTATYYELDLNDYVNKTEITNEEVKFENKSLSNVTLKFSLKCSRETHNFLAPDDQLNHSIEENSFVTGNFGNLETDVVSQITKDKLSLETKTKDLERQLTELFEIYNIQKLELDEATKSKELLLVENDILRKELIGFKNKGLKNFLEEDLIEKTKQIQDLKQQTVIIENQSDIMVRSLESSVENISKQLVAKETEIEQLKKTTSALNIKIQENEKLLRQRQYDMMKIEDKSAKLQSLLKENKENHEKEILKNEFEITSLKKKVKELEHFELEMEEAQSLIHELRDLNKKLDEQNLDLNDKYDSEKNDKEIEIAKLKDIITNLNASENNDKTLLKTLTQEKEKFENLYTVTRNLYNSTTEKLEELEKLTGYELSSLRNENASYQEQISKKERECSSMKKKIADLKSKLEKLNNQFSEVNEKFKGSEKVYIGEIEDYKRELAEKLKIIKHLIAENEAIALEKESINQGFEYFQNTKEVYEGMVAQWETIKSQFGDKEKMLFEMKEEDIRNLRQTVDNQNIQMRKVRSNYDREINKLHKELKDLQKDYIFCKEEQKMTNTFKVKCLSLEKKNQDLSYKIELLESELDTLNANNDKTRYEIELLKHKLGIYTAEREGKSYNIIPEELQKLTEKIETLDKQIRDLEKKGTVHYVNHNSESSKKLPLKKFPNPFNKHGDSDKNINLSVGQITAKGSDLSPLLKENDTKVQIAEPNEDKDSQPKKKLSSSWITKIKDKAKLKSAEKKINENLKSSFDTDYGNDSSKSPKESVSEKNTSDIKKLVSKQNLPVIQETAEFEKGHKYNFSSSVGSFNK